MTTNKQVLEAIERRFKEATGLSGDLGRYPVEKGSGLEFITDRDKSRDYAEVFTPPYMVDRMLATVPAGGMTSSTRNLDLCAGHGQFTVRILRKLYEEEGESINLKRYITERHFFAELQPSSCWKILWVFSGLVNLAIGDALKLGRLPSGWRGVWLYVEGLDEWVDVTGVARGLRKALLTKRYSGESELQFSRIIDGLSSRLAKAGKEYRVEIKHILSTKEGRRMFLEYASKAADGIEQNWQSVGTPEWVVKEMVKAVPDVKSLKRILVLFNIEFLEYVINGAGVKPSRIEFGYDSEIEGKFAESFYKVKTFPLGKDIEQMKLALGDKVGRYDVVFSNPPYQVMDGGFKASAKPIYHEIVMYAIDVLQPQYVCMITPSRWMAGGKGLDQYRARMLKDKRLRLIQDFPGSSDVFDTVAISGGVSYFLWDRDYNGLCEFFALYGGSNQRDIGEFDVLVRDNTAHQILKKVLAKHTGAFCDSRVLPRKPFGLPTNFKDWVPEGTPGAVKVYYRLKGDSQYTLAENLKDEHGVLGKWKVLTSRANGAGQETDNTGAKTVLAGTLLTRPAEACTETLNVIGSFSAKKEAENYAVYTSTKFYRFMLSLRVISQDLPRNCYAWVPDLGDYSKAWTDEELYEHFGLTKQERDRIEKTIKSLD